MLSVPWLSIIPFALVLLVPATSTGGGELDVLLEKAELARKEKRPEEALRLFRDLLTKAPDHREAHLGYQKLLQSQAKEPELVKEYQKLVEAHPEPWALFLLGVVLHDPPREEALYRRALEKAPEDFDCRLALGWALERQLRRSEAKKEYREALRLRSDSFEAHRRLINLFDQEGNVRELLPEYQDRVQKGANDWLAHILYGGVLEAARDLKGSWRHLDRARELVPKEPKVLGAIATYYLKQNDLDQAKEILEKLLREDPFNASGLAVSGLLKAMRRDPGGLRFIEEAVRLEPSSDPSYFILGSARLIHRDLSGAEAAFKEAIRLNGVNDRAISKLGELCMSRLHYQQAREWFERAIHLRPKVVDYRIMLAEACKKLGLNDRALEELEAAERLRREERDRARDPADSKRDTEAKISHTADRKEVLGKPLMRARELVSLASALLIAGRFEEAIERFEESIRVAPTFDEAYLLLARVERRRGRYKEALAVYSRLQASGEKQGRSPDQLAEVLAAMAECRYELGERQEAILLWRAVTDKLPEGLARSRLEEMIRRLETPPPGAEIFRIKDLRITECTRDNWCVPQSVAAVLSHWKITTNLQKLAGELGVGERGIAAIDLLEALKKRSDVKAACFSFRSDLVKQLLKKGYPVIWIGFVVRDRDYRGHVSVVAGFDDYRGAFRLEDSNWFAGIESLSFADSAVDRGILIAPPTEFAAVSESLPDRRFWELVSRAETLLDKDAPGARGLLEDAVKLRADEYLSQLYLGTVQESAGSLDAALEAYRRADGLPGADGRVNSRTARVFLRRGKVAEAEAVLQEGLKRDPNYPPVLAKLLDIAWKHRQNAAQALPFSEQLLAAEGDSGEVLFTRGQILLALDRYDEAIESFTWAANAEGPAEAHLYLGRLLRAKGELRRAIAALEKYASLVKDQEEAEKTRQTIGEIRKEVEAKSR